jgi:hypothetical protein
MLMQKLQDQTKKLKEQVEALSLANFDLTHKFGTMKTLLIEYEKQRIKHNWEADAFIN